MKRLLFVLVLCAYTAMCISQTSRRMVKQGFDKKSGTDDVQAPSLDAAFVQGNNQFAFRMFGHLADKDENIIFSPFSIYSAFSMAYAGSGGETKNEIGKLFGYYPDFNQHNKGYKQVMQEFSRLGKSAQTEFGIANSIVCHQKYKNYLKENYVQTLKGNYDAELFFMDFNNKQKSVDDVNRWVESKTKKRIQNLIKDSNITPQTALILLNAAYFKATWESKFDPKATKPDYFYYDSKDPSRKKYVDMMQQTSEFGYLKTGKYQILEMPYSHPDLSMVIILPADTIRMDFETITESYEKWMPLICYQRVNVHIPRFEVTFTANGMSKILSELGLKDSFNEEKADFFGILALNKNRGDKIWIEDVLHKAYIKVNEEGSEAAAATAIITCAAPASLRRPSIPVFNADRPFLYLIRHKSSGAILFMGKLVQPQDTTLPTRYEVILGDTLLANAYQQKNNLEGDYPTAVPVSETNEQTPTFSDQRPSIKTEPDYRIDGRLRQRIYMKFRELENKKLLHFENNDDMADIEIKSFYTDSEGAIKAYKLALFNLKLSPELQNGLNSLILDYKPPNIQKSAMVNYIDYRFRLKHGDGY